MYHFPRDSNSGLMDQSIICLHVVMYLAIRQVSLNFVPDVIGSRMPGSFE